MLRSTITVAGLGLALGGSFAACSAFSLAASDDSRGSEYTSSSGSSGVGGRGGGINTNFNGGGAPSPLDYGVLCGGACQPGTAEAAECEVPAGDGGAGGIGGAGPSGAGGAAPSGQGGAAATGDCKLGYDPMANAVEGVCLPSGSASEDMPCLSSDDCGPGLGCDASGLCRPYCCGDVEACPEQTYCAPQPMAAADVPTGLTEVPHIPVCVPADQCTPLMDGSCPDGKTCTIVRVDGTTACVDPGSGETGDPCPCAAGHACQFSTGTCIKLCTLGEVDACGPGYFCQSSNQGNNVGYCIEIQ